MYFSLKYTFHQSCNYYYNKCSPPSNIGDLSWFWLSCLGSWVFVLRRNFVLFHFQIFWAWLVNVVPETRGTHWVWYPLMEQELFSLPEHTSSPSVFSEVRVTRSLVLCVCFVDSVCPFNFKSMIFKESSSVIFQKVFRKISTRCWNVFSQLLTGDEIWCFGSKLTIVSVLCRTMVLIFKWRLRQPILCSRIFLLPYLLIFFYIWQLLCHKE